MFKKGGMVHEARWPNAGDAGFDADAQMLLSTEYWSLTKNGTVYVQLMTTHAVTNNSRTRALSLSLTPPKKKPKQKYLENRVLPIYPTESIAGRHTLTNSSQEIPDLCCS